jgi:LSD1 subclass zinc finger protein
MRQKLAQFMYGRNGVDHFTRFLTYLALALIVFELLFKGTVGRVLWYVAVLILVYAYFRIFSKNVGKRREENAKYFQYRMKLVNGFRDWKVRRQQSRDYKFFRCPSCRSMLRVPRGKGKVRVTCRKCGTAFERKT